MRANGSRRSEIDCETCPDIETARRLVNKSFTQVVGQTSRFVISDKLVGCLEDSLKTCGSRNSSYLADRAEKLGIAPAQKSS
jgi:hypothetical protein